MSKFPYYLFLVGANIGIFLMTVLYIASEGGLSEEEAAPVVIPLLLIAGIAHLTFIYKFWASIRNGNPRTSPGKAIGLLFVPIFNIYWIFQVYGGFATDYNRYITDQGIDVPQIGQGLLVFNVLLMIVPIPLLNWIVQVKTISRICNAVNALMASGAPGAPRMPTLEEKYPLA